MIYIVIRWETVQMPNHLEWRIWKQLKGAFFPVSADVKFIFVPISSELNIPNQYNTMEEALNSIPSNVHRVFLEPKGTKDFTELPKGDIAIICGNTAFDNLKYAKENETYRIDTPGRSVLYAHNAVAIVLAHKYL